MNIHYYLLFVVLLFSVELSGQTPETGFDRIELKSGTVVSGTITAYKAGKYVKMVNVRGRERSYLVEAIERIHQTGNRIPATGENFEVIQISIEDIVFTCEVHKEDGTIVEGEILAYQSGEQLQLKQADGSILEIEDKDIVKIVYLEDYEKELNLPAPSKKAKSPYLFEETGWFQETSFAFSFGERETGLTLQDQPFGPSFQEKRTAIGFNVQHVVGYQYNRFAGVGLGLSYDGYDLEEGESIITVFGQFRSYLSKSTVSPFVSLSAGYGFAANRNKSRGVREAEGGWMAHPEIGLRLGASNKTNFLISGGYRLQEAYYIQEVPFSGDIEYRDLVYKRFLFKLALLF